MRKTTKTFDHAFVEKLPFELKYKALHQDQDYVWLHNKAKPNFTLEGQSIGHIGRCGVINEIQEEKTG